jgi:hypothetical protein
MESRGYEISEIKILKNKLKTMKIQLLGLCLFIFMCACSSDKTENTNQEESAVPETTYNHLTEVEKAEGWQLLFDGETTGLWRAYQKETFPNGGWEVNNGELHVQKGGGDIITKEQFGNFDLKMDFLLSDTANSGIFYLAIEEPEMAIWQNCPEYQILDNQTYIDMNGDMSTHLTAENYDLQSAPEDYTNPVGEWNTARIIHNNGHVEHWLNGKKTVEYDIGSEEWESLVKKSKFADYPKYGRAKKGHIGLQDHGHLVKFRNLKIKKL